MDDETKGCLKVIFKVAAFVGWCYIVRSLGLTEEQENIIIITGLFLA